MRFMGGLWLLRAVPGLIVAAWAGHAEAYTWMVRHGYAQCGACHVDPSGSGPLTAYGRGVGGLVMSMPWGPPSDEPSNSGGFLWGAAQPPEWLLPGGDVRLAALYSKIEGVPIHDELFLMQADVSTAVTAGRLVMAGSIGYADRGALGAAITRGSQHNLVSRQHWIGFWVDASKVLVRAGRINLPFGVRSIEHTLFARSLTRTTINDDQQHGVALSLTTGGFRGELMAVFGNFQLRPDIFRERGYSLYAEWLPSEKLALGVSSLITHRELDPNLFRKTFRHVHGLSARWATSWEPLVVLAEFDYTLRSPEFDQRREGVVGFVQGDVELTQGVHVIATTEAHNVGVDAPPASLGAWLSYAWFVAPHADLRLDTVYYSLGGDGGRTDALTLLMQAHLYL